MKRPAIHLLLTAFLIILVSPIEASAYTDPGSGAFLYQAAYGAILAGVFYFRRILDKIWGRRK